MSVSQVDCYKRNYATDVCVVKCPFRSECDREFEKLPKPKAVVIDGVVYECREAK